ncbi:MAG: DUF190 domain-containing protein [candidate division KSB1 bacterium]|nr:DUF190 domain-containing protein [candidate division KSB1 bacterium]
MPLPEKGQLLRIYIAESDHYEGKPLFEWIVNKAREMHIAGATVLRGQLGYGRTSVVHNAKILRLSEDLPLVIEMIDVPDKIDAFLPIIQDALKGGLVTVENVSILLYQN